MDVKESWDVVVEQVRDEIVEYISSVSYQTVIDWYHHRQIFDLGLGRWPYFPSTK